MSKPSRKSVICLHSTAWPVNIHIINIYIPDSYFWIFALPYSIIFLHKDIAWYTPNMQKALKCRGIVLNTQRNSGWVSISSLQSLSCCIYKLCIYLCTTGRFKSSALLSTLCSPYLNFYFLVSTLDSFPPDIGFLYYSMKCSQPPLTPNLSRARLPSKALWNREVFSFSLPLSGTPCPMWYREAAGSGYSVATPPRV